MLKIQDADVKNQKVIVRVDFNVPLAQAENGKFEVQGDKRIRESIPTIRYLLEHDVAEIVLMTHLGKPKGEVNPEFSLWPVANRLAEILGLKIVFDEPAPEYKLSDKITLLENIRFNKGEEENDLEFARSLASKGSIYVNDAFGTCHRAHASTEALAKILPHYAGFLVQEEVARLDQLVQTAEKPFTLILGGAKIGDKLPVLKRFQTKADNFLIGGAIANTFLIARRHFLGKSLVEKDSISDAVSVWQNLMDDGYRNLYLPKDLLLSTSIEEPKDEKLVNISELQEEKFPNHFAVDIGPNTIDEFKKVIGQSKTIFWNGNMGISEVPAFAKGTQEIAKAVINLAENSVAQIVVGGGDTVVAVEQILSDNGQQTTDNLFLSTGGGATLEYLSGKVLPGLKALE